MEAASGGYNDIVKLLMEHGADLNAQSSSGNTPLHYACCGGYEDVVVTLLDAGASIEETNENGHTPLMEAASAGHVGVAKILLDRGAGINTHSNEFKESALTLACYKGHLEMVKFLLEAGADQEHKTGAYLFLAHVIFGCGISLKIIRGSIRRSETLFSPAIKNAYFRPCYPLGK